MLSEGQKKVVVFIADIFNKNEIDYVFVGSSGLAIRGMDFTPADIDIFIDEKEVSKINELLGEYVVMDLHFRDEINSKGERIRNIKGVFKIENCEVEIFTNSDIFIENKWKPVRTVKPKKVKVKFEGVEIWLNDLEFEYEAYKNLGRSEKAEKIKQFMKSLTGAPPV